MSVRPIFTKPTLVTEWIDDDQEERDTYWTSLFYDLILVAGVGAISDPFNELMEEGEKNHPENLQSGLLVPISPLILNAIIQFSLLFIQWLYFNEYTSTFEDESLVGHIASFVYLLGLAMSVTGCVGELEEAYTMLAYGIIVSKIGLISMYIGPYLYIEKARSHLTLRCVVALALLCITAISIYLDISFHWFRKIFIVLCILDILSFPMIIFLKDRLRIHIANFTDRYKDLTLIIFGEAIFSITIQEAAPSRKIIENFGGQALTLWLIYSLALNEFNLYPKPDEHALRRSIIFAILWNVTMQVKTIFLLGTSVGIKRAHFLIWESEGNIDIGTKNLLIYGISFTLFSVVFIRSYSFGWGRHPNVHDPPRIKALKYFWWFGLGSVSISPLFVEKFMLLQNYESITSLLVVKCLGILLALLTLLEAIISNLAAAMLGVKLESGGNYLGVESPPSQYNSITVT